MSTTTKNLQRKYRKKIRHLQSKLSLAPSPSLRDKLQTFQRLLDDLSKPCSTDKINTVGVKKSSRKPQRHQKVPENMSFDEILEEDRQLNAEADRIRHSKYIEREMAKTLVVDQKKQLRSNIKQIKIDKHALESWHKYSHRSKIYTFFLKNVHLQKYPKHMVDAFKNPLKLPDIFKQMKNKLEPNELQFLNQIHNDFIAIVEISKQDPSNNDTPRQIQRRKQMRMKNEKMIRRWKRNKIWYVDL